MTVEYEPHSKGFYYVYSLKSLIRLRNRLVQQRSFYLVNITNVLDHTFPEFKSFFHERLSNNSIFEVELNSLLTLYQSLVKEIDTPESKINKLIEEFIFNIYLCLKSIPYLLPPFTLNTEYQIKRLPLPALNLA